MKTTLKTLRKYAKSPETIGTGYNDKNPNYAENENGYPDYDNEIAEK